MTRWFERFAEHYLGIRGLVFKPGPLFSRRIVRASALPTVAIAVLFVDLYVDLVLDDSLSPAWERVTLVTANLQSFITTLSVAVLFLLGMGRWERWEGSWMLLIGAALVFFALFFGAGAFATSLLGVQEALDLRSFTWSAWAARPALLAFGYLFVAHRALSDPPLQAAIRRYRRRRSVRGTGPESVWD